MIVPAAGRPPMASPVLASQIPCPQLFPLLTRCALPLQAVSARFDASLTNPGGGLHKKTRNGAQLPILRAPIAHLGLAKRPRFRPAGSSPSASRGSCCSFSTPRARCRPAPSRGPPPSGLKNLSLSPLQKNQEGTKQQKKQTQKPHRVANPSSPTVAFDRTRRAECQKPFQVQKLPGSRDAARYKPRIDTNDAYPGSSSMSFFIFIRLFPPSSSTSLPKAPFPIASGPL